MKTQRRNKQTRRRKSRKGGALKCVNRRWKPLINTSKPFNQNVANYRQAESIFMNLLHPCDNAKDFKKLLEDEVKEDPSVRKNVLLEAYSKLTNKQQTNVLGQLDDAIKYRNDNNTIDRYPDPEDVHYKMVPLLERVRFKLGQQPKNEPTVEEEDRSIFLEDMEQDRDALIQQIEDIPTRDKVIAAAAERTSTLSQELQQLRKREEYLTQQIEEISKLRSDQLNSAELTNADEYVRRYTIELQELLDKIDH